MCTRLRCKMSGVVLIIALVVMSVIPFPYAPSYAQRPKLSVYGVFHGDTCYTVLVPGAIPAIKKPLFVTGESADAQMSSEEPVLGVIYGGEAKAYSLWHLDDHEIVNDTISGVAIAATW